ncbi:CoA-binding protein, partial [Streptococcus halichoeri]
MYQFHNPSDQLITDYLQKARRIAVVGLSNRPETASYQVAQFMQSKGYEIIPVNPRLAGQ